MNFTSKAAVYLADDYEPAASPNQLANDYSGYVVRADSVAEMSLDEGRVTMTLADFTVLPVHETDLIEPLTIEWWVAPSDAALLDGWPTIVFRLLRSSRS